MGVLERLGEIATKYANRAVSAAPEWARNAAQAAEKWERNAKSADAERNYATGVQYAAQNQLRLRGLQSVSAADWSGAVSGSQDVYAYKVSVASPKWQSKFEPYAAELDRIVPTLPARIPGQPRENVMNRVVPIAEALHAKKVGGAVTRALGPTATPAAPRYPFGRR